jgi:hypothetical protein
MTADARAQGSPEPDETREPNHPRSRRALLTAAAAAGGALATQALIRPTPAAAADVVLGAVNTATAVTTIRNTQALNSAKALVGLVTYAGAGPSTAGVQGQSLAANGNGVFGVALSGTGAKGVWGRSALGVGVYGEATDATAATVGVRGETKSTHVDATGVLGVAQRGQGVDGLATGGGGIGVRARAYGDVGIGVAGQATGSQGDGVMGTASGTNGIGVVGDATAFGGTGVFGRGSSTGVYGIVQGATGVTYGVRGWAYSPNGFGVYGEGSAASGPSVGARGIAYSPGGYGVQGVVLHTTGVNTGVYGQTNSPNGWAGYFSGRVHVQGNLSKTGGSFLIDHPQDPANKTLEHSFVEAPERLNVYRGNVSLDAQGGATVRLPRYFHALNTEYSYQLTPIGPTSSVLHIAREINPAGTFRIAGGSPGQRICWQVTGARQDAWAQKHPLRVERSKKRKDRGKYLNPEVFGKPRSASMHPIPKVPRRPRRLPRPNAA